MSAAVRLSPSPRRSVNGGADRSSSPVDFAAAARCSFLDGEVSDAQREVNQNRCTCAGRNASTGGGGDGGVGIDVVGQGRNLLIHSSTARRLHLFSWIPWILRAEVD
ncbi:hypothetical protein BS78_10G067300 [Paspalum vaginatum]|nr:hypothetical protein BS78_10G067300 [Paspalum vaginatum]